MHTHTHPFQLGAAMPVWQPSKALSLHNFGGTSGYTCMFTLQTRELEPMARSQEEGGLRSCSQSLLFCPLLRGCGMVLPGG